MHTVCTQSEQDTLSLYFRAGMDSDLLRVGSDHQFNPHVHLVSKFSGDAVRAAQLPRVRSAVTRYYCFCFCFC